MNLAEIYCFDDDWIDGESELEIERKMFLWIVMGIGLCWPLVL